MTNLEERKKANKGFRHLVNATKYSLAGMKTIFKSEAAFRQEVLLLCVLTPLAIVIPVPLLFKAYLITSGIFILIVELLNTGLEYFIDGVYKGHDKTAKDVKDMGSTAVMLSLVNLGIAWFFAVLEILL